MKIQFFELEGWEKDVISKANLGGEVVFVDGPLDETRLPADNSAEVISTFVDSTIGESVLAHFPNLKLIATRSTGYDHIDLSACNSRGVLVVNVPSYGEDTVAEYTFALLLSLTRKIFESYDRIRETGSFSLLGLRGVDLKGKTLGVVGTGRIGKNVIEIAKGFNLNVVAFDKFPDQAYADKMGYKYLSLDEVLSQSDILTLHVPYLPENHHLLNESAFAKMKSGAYLINTARGGLIDTTALVKGLKEGKLAGAGLDVLEEEGVIKDELNFLTSPTHPGDHDLKIVLQNHLLVDMPNVIVTPHNAFNTWEALGRILQTTLDNIQGFVAGEPKNVVK